MTAVHYARLGYLIATLLVNGNKILNIKLTQTNYTTTAVIKVTAKSFNAAGLGLSTVWCGRFVQISYIL